MSEHTTTPPPAVRTHPHTRPPSQYAIEATLAEIRERLDAIESTLERRTNDIYGITANNGADLGRALLRLERLEAAVAMVVPLPPLSS